MLDIPDVRLGSHPAVNCALHHSVARVLVTVPLLQRLAARGLMVTLLAGGAAILPGIGMLLVLPVLMLERADALGAMHRARLLTSKCWGPAVHCPFRHDRTGITTLLVSGVALALAGILVMLWGDHSATITGGLLAAGFLLATVGLAAHNASRTVLAVVLFRYARDGRANDPFDATTLTRAGARAPKLIHLLAASGALVPSTSPPITIGAVPGGQADSERPNALRPTTPSRTRERRATSTPRWTGAFADQSAADRACSGHRLPPGLAGGRAPR